MCCSTFGFILYGYLIFFFDQGGVEYTQYHCDLYLIRYINTKIDAIYILINFVSLLFRLHGKIGRKELHHL